VKFWALKYVCMSARHAQAATGDSVLVFVVVVVVFLVTLVGVGG
jgi:hypothetical protein